jgi:hypothetical protein
MLDPMQRVLKQLRRILEVELLLELGLIGFDSLHAELQFLGDLAGPETLADALEDLELAIRQAVDRETTRVGPRGSRPAGTVPTSPCSGRPLPSRTVRTAFSTCSMASFFMM